MNIVIIAVIVFGALFAVNDITDGSLTRTQKFYRKNGPSSPEHTRQKGTNGSKELSRSS